jgi:hypothetical protein
VKKNTMMYTKSTNQRVVSSGRVSVSAVLCCVVLCCVVLCCVVLCCVVLCCVDNVIQQNTSSCHSVVVPLLVVVVL